MGFSANYTSAQTTKNIFTNVLFVAADLAFNLWYIPFLIGQLGSTTFGFITLALSTTNYLSVLTYSANLSLSRQITMKLMQGEIKEANYIFNTSLGMTLLAVILAAFPGIGVAYFSPNIFTITPGLETEVRFLFLGVLLAFLVGTYRVNFSMATFATNRFDLRNAVLLGTRFTQAITIVSLFKFNGPNLFNVTWGLIAATTINLAGDYLNFRRLLPDMKINLFSIKWVYMRDVFGYSAQSLIYQAGFILILNTDLIIANRTVDLKIAGIYGALLGLSKNLRILAAALGSAWGPLILTAFSRGDRKEMDHYIIQSIKLTGLAIALPVGLLCGLGEPFLNIWLGHNYQGLGPLLIFMLLPLVTNLIVDPFLNTQLAMKRFLLPAFLTLALAILNFPISYFLGLKFGVPGIVISGALFLSLIYSIFMPIHTARIMNFPSHRYLQSTGIVFMACLAVTLSSLLLNYWIQINTWVSVLSTSFIISVLYAMVIYLTLRSDEKQMLIKTLQNKLFPKGSGN